MRLGDLYGRSQAQAPQGGNPLAAGIASTAQALGMDPMALAAIISYETGGTFDPTQAGPTTQWGQHRGLIQFGEPQAREYGVDWSDPVGSQLGPNGAIANYFRSNGWQPGMSVLDAYSIVNAGAPGRYNASDAGNGGAPGTVADKVNEQFGPHWENAQAFLGGGYSMGTPVGSPAYEAQGWNGAPQGNALAGLMAQAQPAPPPMLQLSSLYQDPSAFMQQPAPQNALGSLYARF